MLQERVIRWTEEWKQQGLDEGRAEGEAKGKRDVLLMLLDQAGASLTEDQRRKVDACRDPSLLDEWIRKTVAGDIPDDFLG